jgi:Kef-type K+ transport system membrane component KefB
MKSILVVGIIIFAGFLLGEVATRLKLPKVTGYIGAGILLNPGITGIVPEGFVGHADLVTNLSLACITFAVGGSLFFSKIKRLGKGILWITLCEAEFAFVAVLLGCVFAIPFFITMPGGTFYTLSLPLALLLAALAAPTDPSATLAVAHQYKAKGDVTSTIIGVAGLDDVLGIVNYSIALVFAQGLMAHRAFSAGTAFLRPFGIIAGSLLLGAVFAFLFNIITIFIRKETEGVLIVLIIGFLSLLFGTATLWGVDELLAIMTMGIVVVNFNRLGEKIFRMLERYTEELVFVLFFTISGMHLDVSVLSKSVPFVLLFAVSRTAGKVTGTAAGARIAGSPDNVRKYTAGGLIPQGGIVVGLALMMKQNPAFSAVSDFIISAIIGSTVLHELIGPLFTKRALKKAGEI